MVFTAILAFTGLIRRRPGEIALLLAAAAFMIHRLWTRRRFLQARRAAPTWTERVRAAGSVVARHRRGRAWRSKAPILSRRWRFSDGLEIEDAGGMVYLWPPSGDPAFWPTRAYAQAEHGGHGCLSPGRMARSGRISAPSAPDDDD